MLIATQQIDTTTSKMVRMELALTRFCAYRSTVEPRLRLRLQLRDVSLLLSGTMLIHSFVMFFFFFWSASRYTALVLIVHLDRPVSGQTGQPTGMCCIVWVQ